MFDFTNKTILIIGDIMIDRYLGGGISGTSPEAEVPIFSKISESNHPGGAANVAVNLLELGAKVELIGMVGDDENGEILKSVLDNLTGIRSNILTDPSRKTTVKTRIISEGRHILRVDSEDTDDINDTMAESFKSRLSDVISSTPLAGVIVQDYNKGLLTEDVITHILQVCKTNNMPLFVDPKFNNFFLYKGAKIFKPNRKELEVALDKKLPTIDLIEKPYLENLRNKLDCEILFSTLSEDGLIYVTKDEKRHVAPFPRNIADVCGAGDTVIATIALSYLSGYSLDSIALLANISGGQVCQQSGVIPINKQSLVREYKSRTSGN